MTRVRKPSGIELRKSQTRAENKLVLIVCEDEKSGCDYLKLMARHLRLHTTCIVESSATGSAPISVVQDAIKRISSQKKEKKDPYELIYCVWDIDEHQSINNARQLAKSNGFSVIESDPCFEFWLLLHFTCYTAPIVRKANKSPADECVRILKQHITEYDKSKINEYFTKLLQHIESAKNNADKVRLDLQSTGASNPCTDLDKLIIQMENKFQ